jgi:outer membrane receptor protein involved in Fe transport
MMRFATTVVFILTLLCQLSFGQTQTPVSGKGILTGKVTDAKTGEEMIGASVLLKGTYYGASVDVNGNYTIRNVNPGTYTLKVMFLGYTPIERTGLVVEAGKTLTINFQLQEASLQAEEVVVLGEKPILDLEQSTSSTRVSEDVIKAAPLKTVQDIVATQVGVTQTPDGIHIRGGRSYETAVYVDGVAATDPLSGTGFGLNVSNNAIKQLDVTTGGVGAEYGEAPAGVVAIQTQEGTDNFSVAVEHKRDNFGFNKNYASSFNTQTIDASIGGPTPLNLIKGFPGKLFFFASISMAASDDYYKNPAPQLHSSLVSDFFAPANDNLWSGLFKLTYKISPTDKFNVSVQRSISVNQNTQELQISGNTVQLQPGYQFAFALDPANADTYTHDTNVLNLSYAHTFSKNSLLSVQVSRLFTHLRTEVNGQKWRLDVINQVLDPSSIITGQIHYFNPTDSVIYALPGNGLYNNGGIATLWHDHTAEDYTLNTTFNYNTDDQVSRYTAGLEMKFSDYTWVDITSPWIGAPVSAGEASRQLGTAADIWQVSPSQGAFFVQDQIRFKGLIASIGLRLQYWFPGKFADDAALNPNSPLPAELQEQYRNTSYRIGDRFFKLRLLPKLNASFPVSDNQVMFFSYGHSSKLPHPSYLYAGLDPRYQDNSLYSPLGNPSLQPETTVAYEIGIRNQLSGSDALSITAFYKDIFDYIVSASYQYTDKRTGNSSTRLIYINQDYARVRGLEIAYTKRSGNWFEGNISLDYQIASGQSNSAGESTNIIQNSLTAGNQENFLAWDKPIEVKGYVMFRLKNDKGLFGVGFLNNWRLYVSGTYSSGLRYTPAIFVGIRASDGRPLYDSDVNNPYSQVGQYVLNFDLNLEKEISFGATAFRVFLQVQNLFNAKNAAIINPTTGKAYQYGDPVLETQRDPKYPTPTDSGLPPDNPARYQAPIHAMVGISYQF